MAKPAASGKKDKKSGRKKERRVVPHGTAGVEVRFWRVALGAEVQVSALTSWQAQLSAVF